MIRNLGFGEILFSKKNNFSVDSTYLVIVTTNVRYLRRGIKVGEIWDYPWSQNLRDE